MPDRDPHSSLATRASLLFRLSDWKDTASWTEFDRLYRRLVCGFAERSGLSHAEAEDVTQEVFKRVAETIHDFEKNRQRGSFRKWLMNLTRWRIADKFRERGAAGWQDSPRSEDNDRTSAVDRIADEAGSEADWETQWRQHVLDAALDRIARKVQPRHFQVFDLYVRRQWTVLKVSRELGINPASVYVIGHRLTKQLKAEVSRLQAQLD